MEGEDHIAIPPERLERPALSAYKSFIHLVYIVKREDTALKKVLMGTAKARGAQKRISQAQVPHPGIWC